MPFGLSSQRISGFSKMAMGGMHWNRSKTEEAREQREVQTGEFFLGCRAFLEAFGTGKQGVF